MSAGGNLETSPRLLFVAGTDTGVGKTFVTAALLRAARAEGRRVAGYKPLCCGDRGDAIALFEAASDFDDAAFTLDRVNPCWLKMPAAPLVAARIENQFIDRAALAEGAVALVRDFELDLLLVEGAGGWEAPLGPATETMADLAGDIGAEVLLVIDNKLGALNHTLLTVAAIERRGLRCAGLILNHCADERDSASISNRAVLEEFLPQVPVLADLLHGEPEIDLDSEGGALRRCLFPTLSGAATDQARDLG